MIKRIWHISDTHTIHNKLPIPRDLDLIVHTGDATNVMSPSKNEKEFRNFLTWFHSLPARHKIFVPGNHDTSTEYGFVIKEDFENLGMHMLINEGIELEGLKIWGSPWVPQWGSWAWMVPRGQLWDKAWQYMPDDLDILLTHTPPMGKLDLTQHYGTPGYEQVGCEELKNAIIKNKPKLHCFGHIHSFTEGPNNGKKRFIDNNGVQYSPRWPSVVSNAATNLHGSFGDVWCPGNVIEWQNVLTHRSNYEHTNLIP
jgi:Icc-related predicted phosphoesterase